MRKLYLMMFWLMIISGQAWAQVACDQNFTGSAMHSVPINSDSSNSTIAAIDFDVDAATAFSLNQIEITVSTDGIPFQFAFVASIYEGELGNLIGTSNLAFAGMSAVEPGVFKIYAKSWRNYCFTRRRIR